MWSIHTIINIGMAIYLLSKFCPSSNAKCNTIKRNCLNKRVREYWNKLLNDIKMAPNINSFKNRLESYKLDCISSANERPGIFGSYLMQF